MYGQQNQAIRGGLLYTGENDIRNQIGAAPQENRELPITAQLDELEKRLIQLHETINSLQRRLEWVCCPQPPLEDAKVTRHPGGSTMSMRINTMCHATDSANTKLRLMYDALEI